MKMWTDFVDNIFVINIKVRHERLKVTSDQLHKFRIPFVVWSAISHADGKRGLRETMKLLFLFCIEAGYDRVCVFEDDISILVDDFNELMDKCIEQLPADFDLFYIGGNLWYPPVRVTANILQTPAIKSTHAIIYSRKAIEYIITKLDQDAPYDKILIDSIQKRNKCYCAFPLLVSQKPGYSDIEKKDIDWGVFIERGYKSKTKGI